MTFVKKMKRIGLLIVLMVWLGSYMGVAAAGETCGYWSQQVDESGRMVEVFVYTDPVVITSQESGVDTIAARQDSAEVQTIEAPHYQAKEARSLPEENVGALLSNIVWVGAAFLVILSAVLYKAA